MGIQVSELIKNAEIKPWTKEFIDFEFDGKNVTDFGLVVVFGGDRLPVAASPQFEDETSTINGASGQLYWGTRYGALTQSFTLATDGMSEKQLQAFKAHFQPGKYGKFIEPQYPGRYSYCRVSALENFEVIPFRVETTFMGQKVRVNEYKGDISISFTWDEPFYYSEQDCATSIVGETAIKTVFNNQLPVAGQSWLGANFSSDGVTITTTYDKCLIGSGKQLTKENVIADAISSASQDVVYYNPSTLEKSPKIKLIISQQFSERNYTTWKPVYLTSIADEFNSPSCPYNDIRITGCRETVMGTPPKADDYKLAFKYSSPNVIYSVQRSIQIAYNFFQKASAQSVIELEKALREDITHKNVIAWAIQVLSEINKKADYVSDGVLKNSGKTSIQKLSVDGTGSFSDSWFAYFNIRMLEFFKPNSTFTLAIDGEKQISHITYEGHNSLLESSQILEEKCGDITRSSYLLLKGGDTLDDEGFIHTVHLARFYHGGHRITDETLMQVSLDYKYCYI